MRLNSQPLAMISVNLSLAVETVLVVDYEAVSLSLTGSGIQTTGSGRHLSFDSDNWQVYQTLQVAILDDLDPYDGTVRLMLSVDALSTPVFGEAEATAVIVVMDDDPASIVLAATLTERTTTTLLVSADRVILEGTSDRFTVRLSAMPYADVSVDVAVELDTYVSAVLLAADGSEVEQLNFSSDNWHLTQTLTIESLQDDDIVDGQITLTFNIATTSSEVYGFGDAATETFTLWLEDDDEADITLTLLTATTIYEDGEQIIGGIGVTNMATHSVIVSLTAQPLFDVELALDSHMLTGMANRQFTDVAGSPINQLNFNSANWHIGQTVLLQALVDDDVWDGVVSVVFSVATASSVSWGSGEVSVSRSYVVAIEDDDAVTIGIIASTTTLVEGVVSGVLVPSATLIVRLSADPIEMVSITLVTTNDLAATVLLENEILLSTRTLYFDASNWSTGVTVVATSVDDLDVVSGVVSVLFEVSNSSAELYSNVRYGYVEASATLVLHVIDDDEPEIMLREVTVTGLATRQIDIVMSEGDLASGSTRSVLVRLNSPPLAMVNVNLAVAVETILGVDYEAVSLSLTGSGIQTTGSGRHLSFDSDNWQVYQTLQVAILDDLDPYDGTVRLMLSVDALSTPVFGEAEATAVIVVMDDDPASIVLAATLTERTTTTLLVSADRVILEGTSDRFTVRLSAMPYADVSVDVAVELDDYVSAVLLATDGSEVEQLNFSSDNWHLTQTLTIESLQDDDIVDGQITLTFNIAAASSGVYGFGDAATETFTLWLEDDDEADITLTLLTATTIYEDGEQIIGGIGVTNMATHSVVVALTVQPLFDVELALDSHMLTGMANRQFTDVAGSPINQLNFSSANWHIGQTVLLQVTGDDDVWDGVVSVVFSVATASSISWGSGLVSVSRSYVVGIEDDDAVTISVIASTTTLVEGGVSGGLVPSATLIVRLSADPIEMVSITLVTTNDLAATVLLENEILLSTRTLYFDASNWSTGVTVVATSVDDLDVVSGLVSVLFEVSNSSAELYSNVRYGYVEASATLVLHVIDDDEPEIMLREVTVTGLATRQIDIVMSEGDLASGSTRSVLVRLNSQPLAMISVNLSLAVETVLGVDYEAVSLSLTGSGIQTTGSGSYLSFDSDNWQVYQTLQVAILDDLDPYDGTVRLMLSVDALSTPVFGEAEATAVIVVMDDDPASIVLAATLTERTTTTLLVSADRVILEGTSDRFTVRLSAMPYADVSIDVAVELDDYVSAVLLATDGSEVEQLNFSSDNWHLTQTLTIESLQDDDIVDGQITLTFNIAAASSGVYGFGDAATETFTLWLEDDDEADITLTLLTATTIYEDGEQIIGGIGVTNMATHSVVVALTVQPLFDVELALDSHMLTGMANRQFTDVAGSPINQLNFSSANWHIGQTVLLQALADDDVWDGVVSVVFSISTASSVSWGSGLVSVSRSYVVGIEDDDAVTISVIASTTTLVEGGVSGGLVPSATLIVRLSADPIEMVSITLVTTNDLAATVLLENEILLSTRTLYFDASNWSTGVTVVATSVDDLDVVSGLVSVLFEVSNSSAELYSNVRYGYVEASATLVLHVIDDDEPEIMLREVTVTGLATRQIDIVMSEGDLASGSTRSVLVRLNSQPLAMISVNLSLAVETVLGVDYEAVSLSLTGSGIQTTGSGSYLSFDSDNWQVYQTLQVAILDDLDPYDGTVRLMLSVDALSTPVFGEAEATAVIVVMDDDPASIVLAATLTERTTTTLLVSADRVILEGTSDRFTVRLSAMPYADVSIDVAVELDDYVSAVLLATDGSEVEQLNFSSDNWHLTQTLTIESLQDDDIVDGQITLTFNIAAASSGVYGFGDAATETFTLWLEDDDEADITLTLLTATTIYEDGEQIIGGIGVTNMATHSVVVALTVQPLFDVELALDSHMLTGMANRQFTDVAGSPD